MMEEVTELDVLDAIPNRPEDSHKGKNGRLLAVTGSENYIGAAILSARSALRTGCGYVTVASLPEVCHQVVCAVNEAVLCPLDADGHGHISARNIPMLLDYLSHSDALLIGCGLGQSDDTMEVVKALLKAAKNPVLVDADGLNLLAKDIDMLYETNSEVVLTPHLGEMARLLGGNLPTDDTVANFAKKYHCTVVLKSHQTKTFSVDGNMRLNTTGNSGLAKAGSGDVLSGIIASLMAQGIPPYKSAYSGVWLHGAAADLCREERSCRGMLPSELSDYLCKIFVRLDR